MAPSSLPRRVALAVLLACIGLAAQVQDWPNRPLRIMVGSSPGGGTDAMARVVADKLGPALGVPVVIENKPGASNTLAADATAKSTDGHTLVMGVSTAHAIAPYLFKLGYDNAKDLVPVAYVGAVPNVLVVNNELGIDTVAELVDRAKQQPGKLNFASSGSGSTQHIAAELFKEATGTFITHIPYRGGGPALVDLMAGNVQLSFDTMASVLPHIKNGKVKALAVASAKRSPQLPHVPTLAEAGVKGVEMSAWYGLYVPAATPKVQQDRIQAEVAKLIELPETTASMRINREEVFGPVASVIRVQDYEEALAVANDTPFGLCAGIATSSLKHATHFRRHAQAGMVMVNLPTAGVDYHVPFGGRKGSSHGPREQGRYAAEFYTSVKTACTLA